MVAVQPQAGTLYSLAERDAKVWSPKTAFLFCIGTMVLGAMLNFFGDFFKSLKQPFLAASRRSMDQDIRARLRLHNS